MAELAETHVELETRLDQAIDSVTPGTKVDELWGRINAGFVTLAGNLPNSDSDYLRECLDAYRREAGLEGDQVITDNDQIRDRAKPALSISFQRFYHGR